MTERLLVIGAGWEQRPLVERALQEGLEVHASGPDGSEIEPLVASFHTVDARDLPGLLSVANNLNVDAVVSDQNDYARYAQAWLSERLDLPGPNLDAVAPTTMKHWLRELCREKDIPQPRYEIARSPREAREAADKLPWPIIAKPVDNRGSFGVVRVDRREQLGEAVSDAFAHSHSRVILLEQFVEGTVVTVDGTHDGDGHRVLGIASKRQVAGRRQVAMELYYPAKLPESAIARARQNANAVASVFRSRGATGLTHTEFVYDGEELWLLESANRGGGVFISSTILPAHSGFDTNGFLLDEARGIRQARDGVEASGDAVILSFFPLDPGRIAAVHGFEKVASSPGVLEARLNVGPGDVIGGVDTAVSRAGFVIVAGADLPEALRRVRDVEPLLELEYE